MANVCITVKRSIGSRLPLPSLLGAECSAMALMHGSGTGRIGILKRVIMPCLPTGGRISCVPARGCCLQLVHCSISPAQSADLPMAIGRFDREAHRRKANRSEADGAISILTKSIVIATMDPSLPSRTSGL